MRLLRRLAVLAAVLALGLVLAPGAMAGGPTSVLLVTPSTDKTASLHYSQKEYSTLLGLLESEQPKGRPQPPAGLELNDQPRQINVTWLIHDVTPWRLDRIYLSTNPGVVWIHTAMPDDVAKLHTTEGVWHRAKQPLQLAQLLDTLGLTPKRATADRSGVTPAAPTFEPAQGQEQAAGPEQKPDQQDESLGTVAKTASASSDAATNWWWAIPGLITGAVLALLLRPRVSRLPRPPFIKRGGPREPGPRQELLDG
ncbi:hypothetical protein [Streptomyces sp. NPDC004726]